MFFFVLNNAILIHLGFYVTHYKYNEYINQATVLLTYYNLIITKELITITF